MITVPEVTEKIILSSPFLEEALSESVINYSALARKIKPEIQKKLLKNIKTGAIIMALRRLSRKIKPAASLQNILKLHRNIIVRSNLIEFVISNSDFSVDKHKLLLALSEGQQKSFLTITKGVFETSVIASRDLYDHILEIFPRENIINQFLNLSSVTIHLPQENIYVPGLYYFFLKSLAWVGINVIEVVSTYTEFTVVIETRDVDRAFSILKETEVT